MYVLQYVTSADVGNKAPSQSTASPPKWNETQGFICFYLARLAGFFGLNLPSLHFEGTPSSLQFVLRVAVEINQKIVKYQRNRNIWRDERQ